MLGSWQGVNRRKKVKNPWLKGWNRLWNLRSNYVSQQFL